MMAGTDRDNVSQEATPVDTKVDKKKKKMKKERREGKGIFPLGLACGLAYYLKARVTPAGVLVGLLFARHRYKSSNARREEMAREAALSQVMEDIDAAKLRALLGSLPLWVTFPKYERCAWLNAVLSAAWPAANHAVSELVSDILDNVFRGLDIPAVNELVLRKFTLGHVAPKLGGVHVARLTREQVTLDIHFKWGGNPDVELDVKLIGGVLPIPIRLAQLQVFGTVRLVLDFAPNMPVISAISVSTMGRPKANFALQVLGGDVMNLPGLESTVDGIVNNVLAGLLAWPKRIFVPIQKGAESGGPKMVGMLYCRLISAANLPKMDYDSISSSGWRSGKADPYVNLSVHADRIVRSEVKYRTLDPVWNEIHQFKIFDIDTDSLSMIVYDKDDVLHGGDDKIGTVTLPLNLLDNNKVRTFDSQPLDMTGLKHGKKQAHVSNPPSLRFELLYVPFHTFTSQGQEERGGDQSSSSDIEVPDDWDIPPSGMIKIRFMAATSLPAYKLAKLQKPPYVEAKLGHMVQKTKIGTAISESGVEWNQELTFLGVDPETTPQIQLKLRGIRGSFKSQISASMKSVKALHKCEVWPQPFKPRASAHTGFLLSYDEDLADINVNLAGVVSTGGHMQQVWHWNNIDSGDIELEIWYEKSEAVEKLRMARAGGASTPE